MSVLVVGLNHRTAPTEVLEQASLSGPTLGTALAELVAGDAIAEAVVLATCNRVEVYASTTSFHGGVAEVSDLLSRLSGVPLAELQTCLYPLHEARAVQHLLSVACGLDSLLVGESQIQGQVREAVRVAEEQGTTGRVLGELFRHAVRVGRRARTDTAIDAAGRSLVQVGLRLATDVLGPLAGRRALVVGAGSTGALASSLLLREGVGGLAIANRSAERGQRLAAAVGARAVGLADVPRELAAADLVVSSTAATEQVLGVATVGAAMPSRPGRPLFLLDLALPRDVDPAVRSVPGVSLADLETLRALLEGEPAGADVAAVRAIVDEEVAAFLGWQRAVAVAPTVVALRTKAEAVARVELDRLRARLPDLPPQVRVELETTVQRVVDKLLHAPTVRVKQLAEVPGGDSYAEALRELFGLDRAAVSAFSAPLATDGEGATVQAEPHQPHQEHASPTSRPRATVPGAA